MRFQGGVDVFDQQHAEAIDQLRSAHVFLVATLTPETGEVIVSIAGPDRYGPEMLPVFCATVVAAVEQFVIEIVGE